MYNDQVFCFFSISLDDVHDYLQYYFLPTHTRAACWIIGFLLGYFTYTSNKPPTKEKVKQKLNAFLVLILWGISLGTLVLCIMIGREMMGIQYDWVSNAFHVALIRPAWSLSISWMIFACIHGYGGPLNSFLSIHFFEVLSRITYCTYLVNLSVIFIVTYQTRTALEFSNFDAFYRYLSDVVLSFALGLVWTLAFESPFIAIGKVIFYPSEKSDVKVISKH